MRNITQIQEKHEQLQDNYTEIEINLPLVMVTDSTRGLELNTQLTILKSQIEILEWVLEEEISSDSEPSEEL